MFAEKNTTKQNICEKKTHKISQLYKTIRDKTAWKIWLSNFYLCVNDG